MFLTITMVLKILDIYLIKKIFTMVLMILNICSMKMKTKILKETPIILNKSRKLKQHTNNLHLNQ